MFQSTFQRSEVNFEVNSETNSTLKSASIALQKSRNSRKYLKLDEKSTWIFQRKLSGKSFYLINKFARKTWSAWYVKKYVFKSVLKYFCILTHHISTTKLIYRLRGFLVTQKLVENFKNLRKKNLSDWPIFFILLLTRYLCSVWAI